MKPDTFPLGYHYQLEMERFQNISKGRFPGMALGFFSCVWEQQE